MVMYVLLRPLRPELDIQLEQFKEASSKPAQLKAFTRYSVNNTDMVFTGKFSPFTEHLLLPVNEILYRTIITSVDYR
jgi:hypothetical protein